MPRYLAACQLLFTLCFVLAANLRAESERQPGIFPTAEQVNLVMYREQSLERWSHEIENLEKRDQTETHSANSILFVGSSSIRLWDKNIAADMAPYPAYARGFGGSRWSDVAMFADRLIPTKEVGAIVFFVANDITGSNDDRTPAEVADLFAYVLGKVREKHAEVPVFYVAVTPTESRFGAWPKIKAGNTLVRQLCQQTDNTYFIGTESVFLDAAGKPRPELFRNDKLHQSRAGYQLWAAAIQAHLDTVLDGAK